MKRRKSIKVTCEDVIGTKEIFSVTYEKLTTDLKVNEFILIDDGKLELQVEEILDAKTVQCKIISGGIYLPKRI
ncbi:MAG: hypothetical protein IPP71_20160 [Bacteroidetes bacterium]|nr:hypothetical protein [Bacteroidota bacterium]